MATLDGNLVAPSQTFSGELTHNSLYGDVAAPAAEATGTLISGFAVDDVLTAPAAECSGVLLNGIAADDVVTAPAAECTGTLVPGNTLSGSVTAPAAECSGYGDARGTLVAPAATVTGTLSNGCVLSGALSAPKATVSGELTSDNVMSGAAVAPRATVTGTLAQGQYTVGDCEAPAANVLGQMVSGNVMSGAVEAPAATVVAGTISFGQILTGAVEAPMPTLSGAQTGSGVRQPAMVINDLVEAYAAWVMNTEGGGITNYTNYAFHSLVEFNGNYYGVSDSGIFQLGGETDDGDNIDAYFQFGITDLDSDLMMRLGTVVFDMRASGKLRLHVTIDGEEDTIDYNVEPLRAGLHPVPVPTGRGLRSRNWQFAISNVEGADFDLSAVDFNTKQLNKRAG